MTSIKHSISRCDDPKKLGELVRYIKDRLDLLYRVLHAARVDEAWKRVKDLPIGAALYCHQSGKEYGTTGRATADFTLHCGDVMTVETIQPVAKRLWVKFEEDGCHPPRRLWFKPEGIERYGLRTEPPMHPKEAP